MNCWKCELDKPIYDNDFCRECYDEFVEQNDSESVTMDELLA